MLPVVDKPVIQYVVEEAVAGGVTDILIVTGRGKRAIEDHFDRSVELEVELEAAGKSSELATVQGIADIAEVFYVRQKEPRGLGHAVLCGAPLTDDEPFFVMLGDELVPAHGILPRMRAVHDRTGASVIAVVPAPADQVHRYGVIAGEPEQDGVWRVTGLIEKPLVGEEPSNLRIFGRYLLTPRVMKILAQTPPGKGGEIQLTDALITLLQHEEIYAVIVDPSEGYDTGNVLAWMEANIKLGLASEQYGEALRESLLALFHPKRASAE
jgi:UTP--glucose-1-phosphate uridylyltransferase